MARGFNTVVGVGATDSISNSTSPSITAQSSLSVWINITAYATSTAERVCSFLAAKNPLSIQIPVNSSNIQINRGFSTTTGAWNFSAPSLNTWHHLIVVYDASSVSNTPIVYIDGTSVTVNTTTAPVGTVITVATSFVVGAGTGGASVFNGKIAEFTVWQNTLLTQNEIKALYKGSSPLKIRKSNVVLYMPLYGTQSGEPNYNFTGGTQTIIGTKFQPHPPVFDLAMKQSIQ